MNREQKERVVRMNYKCATYEQYREWLEAARHLKPPLSSWFCTDCTPEYKEKMILQMKCVRPEIRFRITKDGIEGYAP